MDDHEMIALSFIVRIWTEECAGQGSVTWCGYVTHVPSGTKRYLHSLNDISHFIASHLALLGVPVENV